MNAMAMFYDPLVSYKNSFFFSFMNFHENFINLNEKMEKNGVYLGNQKPLHAENGMN